MIEKRPNFYCPLNFILKSPKHDRLILNIGSSPHLSHTNDRDDSELSRGPLALDDEELITLSVLLKVTVLRHIFFHASIIHYGKISNKCLLCLMFILLSICKNGSLQQDCTAEAD